MPRKRKFWKPTRETALRLMTKAQKRALSLWQDMGYQYGGIVNYDDGKGLIAVEKGKIRQLINVDGKAYTCRTGTYTPMETAKH